MDEDLDAMSREQLAGEARKLRRGIRAHRDSTRHELCWHHPALWGLLPERTDPLPVVPDWPQFLEGCLQYRRSLDEQAPGAPRTSAPYGAPMAEYLNTDLDVTSATALGGLARALESRGLFALHVTGGDDGLWRARFETENQHTEPEASIAEMVAVVESLDEPHRAVWLACAQREFNIGYECGAGPSAYGHGLSGGLLGRMAAAGASLRLTLYPADPRSRQGVFQMCP
jgi:hypothetical protein